METEPYSTISEIETQKSPTPHQLKLNAFLSDGVLHHPSMKLESRRGCSENFQSGGKRSATKGWRKNMKEWPKESPTGLLRVAEGVADGTWRIKLLLQFVLEKRLQKNRFGEAARSGASSGVLLGAVTLAGLLVTKLIQNLRAKSLKEVEIEDFEYLKLQGLQDEIIVDLVDQCRSYQKRVMVLLLGHLTLGNINY